MAKPKATLAFGTPCPRLMQNGTRRRVRDAGLERRYALPLLHPRQLPEVIVPRGRAPYQKTSRLSPVFLRQGQIVHR